MLVVRSIELLVILNLHIFGVILSGMYYYIIKYINRDTMDEDSDDKDTKRKSRNLSEKKRRDQFNLLVNELSSMVATGGRKMDKSTVLKATISFLRNHNEIAMRSRIHEIQEDWKPSFLTNEEFTHLVLEAVDGFIVVFSTSGQIFYVSENITSLLGHLPNELLSSTIFDLVWNEEHNNLYNNLFNPVEEKGQVCFSCHLRNGRKDLNEDSSFELVHFVGYVRSDADGVHEANFSSAFSTEIDATRMVFVGIGRIQAPQLIREMSIVDSNKNEFTSRHSLEWKFLFLDHRAPPIIGYLPFELLGTSGYDYYHVDDLEKVVSCHEALMQKGEGMSCYYRFLTKGQQWIWLQTRFYITYHQWNSKPEFIVCTHRVISYVDVLKYNRKEHGVEMTRGKNSPTASAASSSASATWDSKSTKRRHSQEEQPSDCTSMSADSPTSRLSGSVQQQQHQPMRPSSVQRKPSGSVSNCSVEYKTLVENQSKSSISTFAEPTQSTTYVSANVNSQPLMENYSPSTVLSHIPPVEMSPAQSQLQADLQRKHAELQALIGQQQAELRRVSEQLLMARLGLLPVQDAATDLHPQLTSNNPSQIVSHCQYGPSSIPSAGVIHAPMSHIQQQVTVSCSSSSASSQQSHHSSVPPLPPHPPPPPPPLPVSSLQSHPHIHLHHHPQHQQQQQQQQPVYAVQPLLDSELSITTRFHNRNVVPPSSQSTVVTGLAMSSIPSDDVSLVASSDDELVRTYPPPDSNSSTVSK
ncbi:circadian locomoter output cycles protein kaput [Agrilus planipennis]|uniref:Circadian locomoter output cycles protein kaput n=2 Tax=Agrilus planipennis TaxID=224129 RepID=A0A7F5RP71_AGRPL|nr:circadian locomoter output cycles protein kaput [Agrilus planipennis]